MTEKELLNSLPLFPHKEGGKRLTEPELNKLIEYMREYIKKEQPETDAII